MGQRILVLESDAAFAGEVQNGLQGLGATVEVANDGNQGIDRAMASRPDLILLTIELPGMNGFLVCKKLKKEDALKDVPLVILSSEATEETFEQHKKLRTRAEEYLHKPIAVSALLDVVQKYVKLQPADAESIADDELEAADIVEDDVIVVDGSEPPPAFESAGDTSPEPVAPVSPTTTMQNAPSFDLSADPDEPDELPLAAPAPVAAAPVAAPSPLLSRAPSSLGAAPSSLGAAPTRASMPIAAPPSASGGGADPKELARVREELTQVQSKLAQAERTAQAADQRASHAEQRATTAEQRASSAERTLTETSKKGGATSRELLDLREQLNRKDRELLDLRDQVTARDKQIIEASDRSLSIERELTDLRDKQAEMQRELDKRKEIVDALTADKDTAKKRLEETRSRMERAENRAKELGEELAGVKNVHAIELDGMSKRFEDEKAQAAAAHQKALDENKKAAETVETALRRHHADELAELRDEHAVALKSARDSGEQATRSAVESLRAELEKKERDALGAAAEAARRELADTRRQLEDAAASERARAAKNAAELNTKAQLLHDQLEETESAKSDLETRYGRLSVERDQLIAKVERLTALRQAEQEMLDRVRKALAIGLGLLEDHKQSGEQQPTGNGR
jgi:CheY-like chemotaxis protein